MNKLSKNKIILIIKTAVVLIFLLINFQSAVLYAASGNDSGDSTDSGGKITLANPLGSKVNNLPAFIYMILDLVFRIGVVVAVLALMYVGFMFVTARGDTTKLETARTAFLYTVIGIALLLGAELIASVTSNTVTNLSTGIN